jgi:hypothetical protein
MAAAVAVRTPRAADRQLAPYCRRTAWKPSQVASSTRSTSWSV